VDLTITLTPQQHQELHNAMPDVVPAPEETGPSADWSCHDYPWLRTESAQSNRFVCRLVLAESDMLLTTEGATALRDQLTWLLEQ